jgi:hypothetical protein
MGANLPQPMEPTLCRLTLPNLTSLILVTQCASRDGILERHVQSKFPDINSSLLRLELLSDFLPTFSVLQNAFTNRIEISCFASGFFLNPPVEGTVNNMEQN